MFGLDLISTVAGILLIITSALVLIALPLILIGFVFQFLSYKTGRTEQLGKGKKLVKLGALFGVIVFSSWVVIGFLYRNGLISFHTTLLE